MVSTVVSGQNLRRMARVTYCFVEIDHSIEFAAAANPSVDFLADLFLLWCVKVIEEGITKECMFKRWNGRSDDANSLLVSPRYELPIAGYHILRSHAFR